MSTTDTIVAVFGFPNTPNKPSISIYCQKVETFLRHTSTSYELCSGSPAKGPKGKVPWVEIRHPAESQPNSDAKTETISDSHFIIRHLIAQGISSDPNQLAGLTAVQKAESRAWQAYIEETLSPCTAYERWCMDENHATLVSEIFGNISWPLRSFIAWFVTRKVKSSMWVRGIGRHSVDEVKSLQREGIEALEARLEGQVYFHGDDKPSDIDLIVFAFLATSLSSKANPHWKELVLKSKKIVTFAIRLTKTLFPEYEELLHELGSAEERINQNGTA